MNDKELDAAPSLADLLNDWIKNDPDLGGHFTMEPSVGDFHIFAICSQGRVAWFSEDCTMSTWAHLDDEVVKFEPANTKFFDQVRTHLLDAHNGKTMTTTKGNTWRTRRIGCTTVL